MGDSSVLAERGGSLLALAASAHNVVRDGTEVGEAKRVREKEVSRSQRVPRESGLNNPPRSPA